MVDGSSHVELPRVASSASGALTFSAAIRSVGRSTTLRRHDHSTVRCSCRGRSSSTPTRPATTPSALVMALRHPDVEVVGIGVVAGNVPARPRACRTRSTSPSCAASTCPSTPAPTGRSSSRSTTGQHVHGDRRDGRHRAPAHRPLPTPGHAVDALLAASHRHAGDLTLVTLGPLTNVAIALRRDPTLAGRIAALCRHGRGRRPHRQPEPRSPSSTCGSIPHAVAVVLEAGLPLELVGWDISRRYAVIDA